MGCRSPLTIKKPPLLSLLFPPLFPFPRTNNAIAVTEGRKRSSSTCKFSSMTSPGEEEGVVLAHMMRVATAATAAAAMAVKGEEK